MKIGMVVADRRIDGGRSGQSHQEEGLVDDDAEQAQHRERNEVAWVPDPAASPDRVTRSSTTAAPTTRTGRWAGREFPEHDLPGDGQTSRRGTDQEEQEVHAYLRTGPSSESYYWLTSQSVGILFIENELRGTLRRSRHTGAARDGLQEAGASTGSLGGRLRQGRPLHHHHGTSAPCSAGWGRAPAGPSAHRLSALSGSGADAPRLGFGRRWWARCGMAVVGMRWADHRRGPSVPAGPPAPSGDLPAFTDAIAVRSTCRPAERGSTTATGHHRARSIPVALPSALGGGHPRRRIIAWLALLP